MWMLILRMVPLSKMKECGKKKVTLKDVDEKMESMKSSKVRGRMNISVVYFLANIIVRKTKTEYEGHSHIVKNLNENVSERANKVFLSFIIPMELNKNNCHNVLSDSLYLLAYEAIPALGRHFREAVVEAEDSCPRMCKSRFKKGDLKGFALSEINSQLGATKDQSVLAPSNDEKQLLALIMDDDEKQLLALIMDDDDIDQDVADYVVDDVNSQKNKGKKASGPKTPARKTASTPTNEVEKLIAGLEGLKKSVEDGFMEMRNKLDDHDKRIEKMELYVGEEKNRNQEDEENRLNFFDADYHGDGEEANDGAGCAGKKQTEGENVEENVEKDKEQNEEGADVEKDKEENEEIDGEVPTCVTRTSGRKRKKITIQTNPFYRR
ncbi:uncharacterized protein At3g43530-like [Eutrema salsugineum]|uniref:uncharacterized protein At3g43530-like n=1 Tax=Eutrema salsugineum TaxID=72664 RepID=UPI000CED5E88|nr:uncharacterized protein At3g43530-like [Eutrema salsugineum]